MCHGFLVPLSTNYSQIIKQVLVRRCRTLRRWRHCSSSAASSYCCCCCWCAAQRCRQRRRHRPMCCRCGAWRCSYRTWDDKRASAFGLISKNSKWRLLKRSFVDSSQRHVTTVPGFCSGRFLAFLFPTFSFSPHFSVPNQIWWDDRKNDIQRGAEYCDDRVCLCVCLFASISLELQVRSLPIFGK